MNSQQARIQAYHDQISFLCDMVEDHARAAGLDSSSAYACSLAAGEACENIIRHGYGGETEQSISISITYSEKGKMVIQLVDNAPPFNASLRPEQLPWTEDDPPVGGLGLHIIHRVMDHINYRREGECNILEMIKSI